LFQFWLLLLVSGIITCSQKVKEVIDNDGVPLSLVELTLFICHMCSILVMFILHCFAEQTIQEMNKSPEDYSSFINRLFFSWYNPVIMLGHRKPLTTDDVWELNKNDQSRYVGKMFKFFWNKEVKKANESLEKYISTTYSNEGYDGKQTKEKTMIKDYKLYPYKPSIWKALFYQHWKTFLAAILLKLLNDVFQFLKPALLHSLIEFTRSRDSPSYHGYLLAVCLYLVAILEAICLQQYFHKCYSVGMRIRTSLITVIYDKALRISNYAKQKSTLGEIVNLMSTDTHRLMELTTYLNILWSGPVQIIVCTILLWNQLQVAAIAGISIMVAIMPLNAFLMKKVKSYSMTNMELKDERVKLINEVLNGIKVFKMYGWEPSFEKQIENIRSEELKNLKKIAVLKAASTFLCSMTAYFVSVVSFGVYLAIVPDGVLDSTKTFVSISLFNIIKFPLNMMPRVFTALINAQVSAKRIKNYLLSSDIDLKAVNRKHVGEHQIVVKDGNFAWEEKGKRILHNISFNVKPGELVAIVGHVGSGKSSVISALLGEMEKTDGYVGMRGSVALIPQQAWIQNTTLKENILFGKRLKGEKNSLKVHDDKLFLGVVDKKVYEKTVNATALKSDFNILPAGDETEIGEKGTNLSGGQKQRVSLARAVLQDCDVYLLDDPLSAVDSYVGRHIFDNVIGPKGILKNKTRILVTHSLNNLSETDKIIVLNQGKISEVGKYNDLLNNKADFYKLINDFASQKQCNKEKTAFDINEADEVNSEDLASVPEFLDDCSVFQEVEEDTVFEGQLRKMSRANVRRRKSTFCSLSSEKSTRPKSTSKHYISKGKLTKKELPQEGSVKSSIIAYIKAIGYLMSAVIIFTGASHQASKMGISIWLSDWAADGDSLTTDEYRSKIGSRLAVLGALGVVQAVTVVANVYILSIACLRAAAKMHTNLLRCILRAAASFFDTVPMGRIINRFSKDIYIVDDTLPNTILIWTKSVFSVLSIIIIIMYSTPIFGVVIVPLGILYYICERFYIQTSRQLRRIESVSRSPIFSHFSETLSGSTLLRAFGMVNEFTEMSHCKIDVNQKCYYSNIVSYRWLAIRLDVIGNSVVFFAALFAVIQRNAINGAIVGLSITYALQMTMKLNWLVRQTSEAEIQVVSVERVKEYSEIQPEAPWKSNGNKPKSSWPEYGRVQFNNYSTRYREGLDLVLKNIHVDIKAGEKVGVVGRTGAGKSSLTLAIFRMLESVKGNITIDGINIRDIGLHDLRSKIAIIPQDPFMFSGSLRLNLDPLETHSDDEIWNVLELSFLKSFVLELPEKLMHDCLEGGTNFSLGQRQLVCLARALLKKPKIIVLDEATAAVDVQTDELIQETIKAQFRESTVITIAHRLNTIVDYDRIIVLSEGEIKEFDSPKNLLANKKSIFFAMAKEAKIA